jgi:hypothetical protein
MPPGGTAGKAEPGDVVTYTFSEPMRPASILAGWSGGATAVVVRITQANPNDVISVFDATNTTRLALGTVNAGKTYVTATTTFTASTMVANGSAIVVTLGTPSPANATTVGASSTLQWTTSAAATDLAGNPLTAATVTETGSVDLDF